MAFYNQTKAQLEKELKTDLEKGLTHAEAKARLLAYGPNQLPEQKGDSWFVIFMRQFQSPLIYVLIICAVIIFFLHESTDSLIILVVLVFNAIIGTIQEGRSQQTMKSLKKLSFAEAGVLRQGREEVVPEAEVVPGDILILQEGQKVTADARVTFSSNLKLDEATLTGESGSILKRDAVIEGDAPASGQHNMVFKGTSVLSGLGKAVVTGTGTGTEIGKISRALIEPQTEIPLQRNIKRLSQALIYFIVSLSVVLFFFGLRLGNSPKEMFTVVVSLAVSVIPEGLPLVLTIILVTGVWRMSKRNALVKKMQAVEALGEANVLAVDKTGTLTKNEMAVKKLFLADKVFSVSGNGYEPKGSLFWKNMPAQPSPDIHLTAKVSALVNKATVFYNESESAYKVSGDPTEAAMVVFAEKLGFLRENFREQYRETAEITFEHKNKYHAIFYEEGGSVFCAIAGAPEVLLSQGASYLENGESKRMHEAQRKLFEGAIEEFTSEGLRAVAVGFKILEKDKPLDNVDGLTVVAIFGIEDSLRPEVSKAAAKVKAAGLKIVMITGDHKNTAQAIAKEAGIYSHGDLVLTGNELDSLSPNDLAEKLSRVSVFARVTPEDKMKIIKQYKAAGLTVAMTGDGVNDAPSLVAADLGVAMGRIGTEVAKEAADIVLLDDNLGSIAAAIEEGRLMHLNIKRALQYLFSTSFGELLTVVVALALKMPLPVLAVQILWLNLITDPLLGAGLALEKGETHSKEPKDYKFSKFFVDSSMLFHIALVGTVMCVVTLYFFKVYFPVDEIKARAICLTLLAVFQWYNAINCRFLYKSVFRKKLFTNPYIWAALLLNFVLQLWALQSPLMNKVLRVSPLTLAEWSLVLAAGLLIVLADESRKALSHLNRRRL